MRITLGIVESICERATGPRVDPWLATLYLFGMLNWIYMWYPAVEGATAEELGDQILTLFLEGYLPRKE